MGQRAAEVRAHRLAEARRIARGAALVAGVLVVIGGVVALASSQVGFAVGFTGLVGGAATLDGWRRGRRRVGQPTPFDARGSGWKLEVRRYTVQRWLRVDGEASDPRTWLVWLEPPLAGALDQAEVMAALPRRSASFTPRSQLVVTRLVPHGPLLALEQDGDPVPLVDAPAGERWTPPWEVTSLTLVEGRETDQADAHPLEALPGWMRASLASAPPR